MENDETVVNREPCPFEIGDKVVTINGAEGTVFSVPGCEFYDSRPFIDARGGMVLKVTKGVGICEGKDLIWVYQHNCRKVG